MKYNYFLILFLLITGSCSLDEGTSDAFGNFEATEIIISSEVGGKILSFEFEEGDRLKAGEVIIIIDSADIVLKKNQLLANKQAILAGLSNIEAQVMVNEQQRKNLKKDEVRIENLLKENAATQKQMDDISGQLLLLERQSYAISTQRKSIIEQAGAIDEQVKEAKRNIGKCRISCPIDGTLLTKYAEENELAMPGKPLFKIADLTTMKLRVYVSGEQLASVKEGQEVIVVVDNEGNSTREMKGVVSWVSTEAEFTPKIIQTRKERVNMVYAVKVIVENDGYLKIGMPGEIRFE